MKVCKFGARCKSMLERGTCEYWHNKEEFTALEKKFRERAKEIAQKGLDNASVIKSDKRKPRKKERGRRRKKPKR